MTANEAEEILSSICEKVQSELHRRGGDYKTSDLVIFVHQLLGELLRESYDEPDIKAMHTLYEHEYKLLAKDSIKSYKASNDELSDFNENVVKPQTDEVIENVDDASERFEQIHDRLKEQIIQANKTINILSERVVELEEKSSIDPLTKVYNRYALKEEFLKLSTIRGRQLDLHMMMLDIDDFKSINDAYGHIAGDKILIFIANILKKALRDGDKIYRYGGEEFLIVLNRISDEQCLLVGERILSYIRSNTLLFKEHKISITASIGATKYHEGDMINDVVERADTALYKAKESGKNRMEVHR